jgi:hypothetical protein
MNDASNLKLPGRAKSGADLGGDIFGGDSNDDDCPASLCAPARADENAKRKAGFAVGTVPDLLLADDRSNLSAESATGLSGPEAVNPDPEVCGDSR